jgi:formylglycine-generating enzyme required for sulfatase activity
MSKEPQASGRARAKPAGDIRVMGSQKRRITVRLVLGCMLAAFAGLAVYVKYGEVMAYLNPPVGMKWIAGGEFLMGSDEPMFRDAQPVHRVAVDGFWIDETEVTNAQFAAYSHSASVGRRFSTHRAYASASSKAKCTTG